MAVERVWVGGVFPGLRLGTALHWPPPAGPADGTNRAASLAIRSCTGCSPAPPCPCPGLKPAPRQVVEKREARAKKRKARKVRRLTKVTNVHLKHLLEGDAPVNIETA